MNYPTFQFSNLRTTRIRCVIEPEGMMYEIAPASNVEITITSGDRNAIVRELREDDKGPILSIWANTGYCEVEGLNHLNG